MHFNGHPGAKQRIKAAIKAHEEKIKTLE